MTLHGVDVYLRTAEKPTLPDTIGSMKLVFIASRGTRIYPTAIVDSADVAWPQCRYLSESEVTDSQIEELVAKLSGMGHQWTKCQKLFKDDGVEAFSQPY